MSKASHALEAFVDETILRGHEKGYIPTVFIGMRQDLETIPAISKLVRSGDIQSGFKRLQALGLLDWTIEAASRSFQTSFQRTTANAQLSDFA